MKIKQKLKQQTKQAHRPPKGWEEDPDEWIREWQALTKIYRIQRLIWNNFGFNEEKQK